MKTAQEVKELLNKAEEGNIQALKEVIEDLQDKLDYIDELDKNRKKAK